MSTQPIISCTMLVNGKPTKYEAHDEDAAKIVRQLIAAQNKVGMELMKTQLPNDMQSFLNRFVGFSRWVEGTGKGGKYLDCALPEKHNEFVADHLFKLVEFMLLRLIKIAAWCKELPYADVVVSTGMFPESEEQEEPQTA